MKSTLLAIALVLCFSWSASATLIDRGDGLIYDDVLNVTWLQDVRGAGGMTFDDAISYVNELSYGGYTEWRLPRVLPINGTDYNLNFSFDGSTDEAYNISAPGSVYAGSTASELAYMFFNNLGNRSFFDVNGNEQPPNFGLQNVGVFIGLSAGGYWSLTDYALSERRTQNFNFYNGLQESVDDEATSNVWAVHDGDIAAVPIPSAIWLLGSGLIGFIGIRRKIRK